MFSTTSSTRCPEFSAIWLANAENPVENSLNARCDIPNAVSASSPSARTASDDLPYVTLTALIDSSRSDAALIDATATVTAPASTALVIAAQPVAEPQNDEIIIETPYGERFEVECSEPGCEWSGSYENAQAGLQAKRAHMRKHNGVHVRANGHGE